MSCESCNYWGHTKCTLPCDNATPTGFTVVGLILQPQTNNKLRRDSKGIFIPVEKSEFREFCESTGKLGLLDTFSLKLMGKSFENLDGNKLELALRNRDLLVVPQEWVDQYRAIEKHYRALAANGIDRGINYARKITRTLKERQMANKVK